MAKVLPSEDSHATKGDTAQRKVTRKLLNTDERERGLQILGSMELRLSSLRNYVFLDEF